MYFFWLDEERCFKLASMETWQKKYYSDSQVLEALWCSGVWYFFMQSLFNLREKIDKLFCLDLLVNKAMSSGSGKKKKSQKVG